MKLFTSLFIGSQVAAELSSCPETHPFQSPVRTAYMGPGNDFCCEGDPIIGSCGGQIGCPTEECSYYVEHGNMCPEAFPTPHMRGYSCCETAEADSCSKGALTCPSGTCKAYVAPSPVPTVEDAEVTSDDDDDSEDGCAPDGWRDMNDNTCDYFSSNEMCDFDYEHYAADGYHSAHCKECGCGAQKEEDFPCPTKACWTYNASTASCAMKAECATLQCGATGFDVTFQSALFDLEDNQSLVTFAGGIASPVWDTTEWTKTVALGSTGVTYDINTTTNDISFSVLLAVIGNDMRTRTDDIQDYLINLGTKKVVTTPFGAGVVFKCTYPMSVDISSEDGGTYTVHGASVVDTYSAIGSLAAGFQMVLNNGEDPSFVLGSIVDLAVTWTVTSMPTLTFYLDSCTVTHGATTIGIVKEGCYAAELDVKHESSLQAFSYKVFKGVGEASSTQTIECTINICETNNCGIPTANQCPSAGDDGFYGYTI